MIYHICTALMLIGILGLVAQVLLGGAHAGHVGHQSAHNGGHDASGHGAHADKSQAAVGHRVVNSGRGGSGSFLLTLLSPIVFFSLCIGIGGTGLLIKHFHMPTVVVAIVALAGGGIFYCALIGPLWSILFKFASTPSSALDGAVAREVEVASGFNSEGKGLVKLTIDGQIVQLLAILEADDRPKAASIVRGDKLTITSVDGRSNTCRVTRL